MKNHYKKISSVELSDAIEQLFKVVDEGGDERGIQNFLEKNAFFLLLTPIYDHFLAVSQAPLGSEYKTDFALYGSCNGPWWTLIELEKTDDKIFNKNGDPSSKLVHAMRQVRDWRQWIQENPDYFEANYGNHMGVRRCHINTGIIIGRRSSLSIKDRERLLQINRENHYDWIMTYDGLLERGKQMFRIKENSVIHRSAFSYKDFTRLKKTEKEEDIFYSAKRALWDVEHELDGYRFEADKV